MANGEAAPHMHVEHHKLKIATTSAQADTAQTNGGIRVTMHSIPLEAPDLQAISIDIPGEGRKEGSGHDGALERGRCRFM